MVFSSVIFIGLFLPLFLICYFLVKSRRARNVVLMVFSLFFYAWGEPKWILGMVALTFVDFLIANQIERISPGRKKKLFLFMAVAVNLVMLFLVKYYDFFAGSVNQFAKTNLPITNIAMPIGISFYTFQALTYVVDVYKNQAKPQKNFFDLLLYISMFPQLIAGPIVRYADINEQIGNRSETRQGFVDGMFRFSIGLGKKVIFANYAGILATELLDNHFDELTTFGAWIGIAMFTIQLYFDFSGYSDMAIGLGKVCGFDFKENFRYPYISNSIADFWRRWHISLGSFFRDYVYIPLGGNRKHVLLNTAIVWILTGLWHGASWNYVIWGAFFAVLLTVERQLKKFGIETAKIPVTGNIIVMLIIIYSMSLFYFENLNHLVRAGRLMFGLTGQVQLTVVEQTIVNNYFYIIPVMIIGCTPLPAIVGKRIFKKDTTIGTIARTTMFVALFAVCFILIMNQTYNPFLYFRF